MNAQTMLSRFGLLNQEISYEELIAKPKAGLRNIVLCTSELCNGYGHSAGVIRKMTPSGQCPDCSYFLLECSVSEAEYIRTYDRTRRIKERLEKNRRKYVGSEKIES